MGLVCGAGSRGVHGAAMREKCYCGAPDCRSCGIGAAYYDQEREAYEEAEAAIERRGALSPTLRRLAIVTERAARRKLRAQRNRQLEF